MFQECADICQSSYIDMVCRSGELFHFLSFLHLPVSLALYLIWIPLKALGEVRASRNIIYLAATYSRWQKI